MRRLNGPDQGATPSRVCELSRNHQIPEKHLHKLRRLREQPLLRGLPQPVHFSQHPQAVQGIEAVSADLGTIVDLRIPTQNGQGVPQSHLYSAYTPEKAE